MDPVRKTTGGSPAGTGSQPRSLTASEQLARAFREGPSLLANMEEGYLYCRVVFEGDTAVDYVYLLVNPAWERLTGLRNPIGKRVTELVPGIRETNPDLFEIYGRVARTGEPAKFETFVERLGIWLAVSVYCPEDGCFAGVFQDVSERKRAEQGLREREERYRAVVETSADGVLVLDGGGRILEANEAYTRLSGYSMDELLSMGISDLEARETPEDTARHMERLKRTGSDLFETEHRTKDGLVWSAEVTTSWSPAGGGRFFAFFRDLKRRSHLESLLRVRLRIADLAPHSSLGELATAAADAAEELTASRIAFFHLVGDDERTLRLQAWSTSTLRTFRAAEGNARRPDAQDAGVWSDALRRRAPVVHNVASSVPDRKGLPGGLEPLVREVVVPVVRRGRVVALLGVANKGSDYDQTDVESVTDLAGLVIDVISHKEADDRLAESERLLRIMAESLPAHIAHLDADCRYVTVNTSYAAWFGKPAGSFPGRTVREVVGEPGWARLKPLLERALAGETVTFESELPLGKEGRRRGQGLYTPDRDPGGKVRGIVVIFQEVTDDRSVAPWAVQGSSRGY